ncbi:hypothetical protein Naga_100003g148 [Nannochloropsis gaditana]|uniref:Uncharacterized protein n=1 Tax=Nannochloropsis gaditana TaxID=72520 RepID=W7UB79_9STRA|nr:hypothetical protein Naga_100003g148 [Nannochloropsis gaditana]
MISLLAEFPSSQASTDESLPGDSRHNFNVWPEILGHFISQACLAFTQRSHFEPAEGMAHGSRCLTSAFRHFRSPYEMTVGARWSPGGCHRKLSTEAESTSLTSNKGSSFFQRLSSFLAGVGVTSLVGYFFLIQDVKRSTDSVHDLLRVVHQASHKRTEACDGVRVSAKEKKSDLSQEDLHREHKI